MAKDMPATAGPYIQLHCDMVVEPGREQEMLSNYWNIFEPVISKQPGFISVRMLKLRSNVIGTAPGNVQYRLLITFETEELRQEWIARDIHQQVWPEVSKTLRELNCYLFDACMP